jgi:hypothetical protein
MKNDLMQIPEELIREIEYVRKITPNDKFPCYGCLDDKL